MEQPGSDAELVRRALSATTTSERTETFEAIADRYRLIVFRQCASWFPDPDAAQDVGQAAFEAAFTLLTAGKGPERPDKLAGWLIEIARRRGREYVRKIKPADVRWAALPEGRSLDEIEDDDEPRSGSAVRRAHATRLADRVVATLTDRQRAIYQLRFIQELTGRQIAERLGITDKAASNEATIVQRLIADGFGALILIQEGRAYCPDLARILDTATIAQAAPAAFAAARAGTGIFTTALRQRIVNHFSDCSICDNCRTCNSKRRELVGPYAPALTPILFAAEFRDRINDTIRRVTSHPNAEQNPSSYPGSGGMRAAASDAGTEVIAETEAATGAGNAAAIAGNTVLASTPPPMSPPPVTPVRHMSPPVSPATRGSRAVRRLRQALPSGNTGVAFLIAVAASVTAAAVTITIILATPSSRGTAAPASTPSKGAVSTPRAAAGSGTLCGAAGTGPTGNLELVVYGNISCTEAFQTLTTFRSDNAGLNPDNAASAQFDNWDCTRDDINGLQNSGQYEYCQLGANGTNDFETVLSKP